MQVVRLASETDFAGWRAAARRLRAEGASPEAVIWTVDDRGGSERETIAGATFTVPRAFMPLAAQVVLHRSDERFALLYRIVWRLAEDPGLLAQAADLDLAKARAFAEAVGRAAQRMKAVLEFHRLGGDDPETWIAWFEPAHRVTEIAAVFHARRLGAARFSILTPDVCAHWNGAGLRFTPGVDPADAPAGAALEQVWRSRYGRIFHGHWNASGSQAFSVPSAIAEGRAEMASRPSLEPDRRDLHAVQRASRDAPYDGTPPSTLEEIRLGVQACRRCDLWRCAIQGVAGEGPGGVRLMLVGEQPGDQEDRAGRPFVGPAGQVFDRALAAAGAPRERTWVTNAVKHFKHEPRGKRRLHKTPDAGEVQACRWWLDAERRILRPRVIVAMGATAALAVFGRPTPIGKNRGQALRLPDQSQGLVTYHPSYLLRIPDGAARKEAFDAFVADLKLAWKLAG